MQKIRSAKCDKVTADYDKLISLLLKHQEYATDLIDGKYLDISRKLNEELDHIMIVSGDFNDIQQKGNRLVAESDAGFFLEVGILHNSSTAKVGFKAEDVNCHKNMLTPFENKIHITYAGLTGSYRLFV